MASPAAAPKTRMHSGYLLIADISGYTAFLTSQDVEHAQGIVEQLIEGIVAHVRPPLRLVKLEGDAVFFYAPGDAVADAQRLLDVIESCYDGFITQIEQLRQCAHCGVCRRALDLDLKFFAHHGSYIVQMLGDREDLAGPDVILVHRLLKNSVVEKTGLPAYALLSEPFAAHMRLAVSAREHVESYEHLGEVRCRVLDLKGPSAARREARRERLEEADADWFLTKELPASAGVAWDFCVDAMRLRKWIAPPKVKLSERANAAGRFAAGAELVCEDGAFCATMRYTDWRPFSYFTFDQELRLGPVGLAPVRITYLFEEGGESRSRLAIRARVGAAAFPRKQLTSLIMSGYRKDLGRALEVLAREVGTVGAAEAAATV